LKLVFQIAGGILLAAVLGLLAQTAAVTYVAFEAKSALEEAAVARKEAANTLTKKQLDQEKTLAVAQAQVAQMRLAKQEEERVYQQARRDFAIRKETAWNAYYQTPDTCNIYRSSQHMVECVNERMRASREFEKQYRDGADPFSSSPIQIGPTQ
jgi:uncharacterized protein (DUF1800 family)